MNPDSNKQPNLIVEQPANGTKKSPMEMIKMGFAQMSAKLTAPFSKKQSTTINIVPEKGMVAGSLSSVPKSRKPLIFGAFFVGLVILLVIVVAVVGSRLGGNGNGQVAVSSPTPAAPAFTPAPNKYASDPDIVKLQNDIQSFDSELGQIDVQESNLKPRPYLWDINFK